MIACRSFTRVDRAWKAANSYAISKPVDYFQGSYASHGVIFVRKMGGGKDRQSATDRNKKQKTITPIWRPVSTQSGSSQGSLAKDVNIKHENISKEVACDETSKVGGLVKVVHCTTPGYVLNVQNVSKEGDLIMNEGANTSGVLECSDKNEALDVGSTLSENLKVDSLLQSGLTARDDEPDKTIYHMQVDKESILNLDTGKSIHSISEAEKHSISVEVAAPLIRFIKGKGGCTQKQIEEEMGVKIILPSSKKEDSIIIEGISVESVTKASEKVQVILEEAIQSPNLDYSHFVSLPLAIYPGLVDKLINFQNAILGNCDPSEGENLESDSNGDTCDDGEDKGHRLDGGLDVAVKLKVEDDNEHVKVEINKIPFISYPPKASTSSALSELGIEKSIFIKPKTFHLTVVMLKLWNKERVAAATEVLQSLSSKVLDALDSRPVFVKLKGLECMRGSLAKARVLYAPIEEIGGEGRLSRACQVIIDAFVEAGLVLEKDAQQKLKFHATVMNARHKKRKQGMRNYDSFDARGIVRQYGSEDWGEYLIREAHLSQRKKDKPLGYQYALAYANFV